MSSNRIRFFLLVAIIGLTAGEFCLDVLTPLGMADWVLYLIPLLFSGYAGGRHFSYWLAGWVSILSLVGFYLSPPGLDPSLALPGRLLSLGVFWIMALLISRQRQAQVRLQQSNRILTTITACHQALVRATDEAALLQNICQAIIEPGGFRMAWVGVAENDTAQSVRVVARAGHEDGYLDQISLTWADTELGRGPTGIALRTGQRVICDNLQTDPRFALWRLQALRRGYASSIALPLRHEETICGALMIYAGRPQAFTPAEIDLLQQLAADLAFGLGTQRARIRQQELKASLQQSEERYRLLFDSMLNGFALHEIICDAADQPVDYRFLSVNPAFERMTGLRATEVTGRTVREIMPQTERRWIECYGRVALTGEPTQFQEYSEALQRHFEVSAFRVQPGQFATVFMDITAERQAAAKIREQAAMLNLAHDAITIQDLNHQITYWNHGAEQTYGWSSAEAFGQNAEKLLKLDPFTISQGKQLLQKNGYWTRELTAQTKAGHAVLINATATLVRDEHQKPQAILMISEDITERRKLEQQATHNQRLESLGTLASGIAHDLNNILAPIMFALSLLKEQTKDRTMAHLLTGLETSTQRGALLVKQILAFGRGLVGERNPTNLRAIAREVQLVIQEIFPKSIQFDLVVPDNLWPVIGDATQLHQVFLNLAINARDAMPDGGRLTLSMENHMIDPVEAEFHPETRPGPGVLIQVTDTGAGIPPEILQRIFEPFFTTKPTGEGTGLGLATTLGIVKSHGGFVEVQSQPGQGSTFKIYLPASPEHPGQPFEAPTSPPSQLPRGHNKLILFVDDEPTICEAVKKILERLGYRVLTAANGAEAVTIYTSQGSEIAAVITDMHMPVMDGAATIAALKALNPRIKIIGSSGLANATTLQVRHFVPKPYTTEKLTRTLRDLLD